MTFIDPAYLVPIRDALAAGGDVTAQVDRLSTLIAAAALPPHPAVPGYVTPDFGFIAAGYGNVLVDNQTHVFTLGAIVDARGAQVLRDGAPYAQGVALELVIMHGVILAHAGNPSQWWMDNQAGGWIKQDSGPRLF